MISSSDHPFIPHVFTLVSSRFSCSSTHSFTFHLFIHSSHHPRTWPFTLPFIPHPPCRSFIHHRLLIPSFSLFYPSYLILCLPSSLHPPPIIPSYLVLPLLSSTPSTRHYAVEHCGGFHAADQILLGLCSEPQCRSATERSGNRRCVTARAPSRAAHVWPQSWVN